MRVRTVHCLALDFEQLQYFDLNPTWNNLKEIFADLRARAQALLRDHPGHAAQMKLYLIRHGETVDNVAGLYAGVRDSALTNHGVEQTQRLGAHFAQDHDRLTHIFASPLSRAFKTAEAIQKSQPASSDNGKPLEIIKVQDLIEQDFGYYEGKPFYARVEGRKSGKDAHRERHKDEPGFVDVESKESMARRADAFLDARLLPLMSRNVECDAAVAVVSHGMLLAHLWRRLLFRLPRKSLTIAPEVTASRGNLVLEHLGGWSNTGYLELLLIRDGSTVVDPPTKNNKAPSGQIDSTEPSKEHSPVPPPVQPQVEVLVTDASVSDTNTTDRVTGSPVRAIKKLEGWATTIVAVDNKQHLIGLKRQRGGIGRLKHDEGQKKLDGFFKRQRTA